MNVSSLTPYSSAQMARPVRFAQQQPVQQPEAPAQPPASAEEKPSALSKIWEFAKRMFKIALEGLSWALGFEFVEAIMHRLIPHTH